MAECPICGSALDTLGKCSGCGEVSELCRCIKESFIKRSIKRWTSSIKRWNSI